MVVSTTRVWTIPNLISVAPPRVRARCSSGCSGARTSRSPRRGLLAVLGATDWVDGYIARHFDQGSELGKILDPTADRVLLVAAAVALLVADLPVAVDIVIWLVLIREVIVAAATIALALAGARRIDVVWAGKAGTLALMFALPMFLGADAIDPGFWRAFVWFAGWCFAISAASCSGTTPPRKYVPARAPRCAKAGRRAQGSRACGSSSAEVHG